MDNIEGFDRQLTTKDYLIISSMLFALFFGAGNLIFPLHLGQLAGKNWIFAMAGFIVVSVILPLLAILAMALTRSKGVYDIALPMGKTFALGFMILIQATIGPFFATPRTASISYTVSIAPLVPKNYQQLASIIYIGIFFAICFWISYNENDILTSLGKVLNPIFLALLFLVFLVAFIKPMGNPNQFVPTTDYLSQGSAFLHGFLEGYNTMDALAGLAFGVTIISAVKQMGKKEPKAITVVTMRAGAIGMFAIAVIYFLLIILGAMSLGHLKVSADGGVAFVQIVHSYAGVLGQIILAMLMTLTCVTTAAGLIAAFAQDFHTHFPKLSYHAWLTFACVLSFIIGNFGLVSIIMWSKPILMLIYPISIALIFLALLAPLFKNARYVFMICIGFTLGPAILDMLANIPPIISNLTVIKNIITIRKYLPFANMGFSWLVPMLIGLFIGYLTYLIVSHKVNNPKIEA